ncbi:glycosyltransferase family 39 protein [Ottowia sp.]|uniref:ArnT family glycosyltransferase n=1 Tax=Ottowia sp. TaxID=1898956 RepID=UPI002B9F0507|nr:glycosyltransferase family 39 protein [Ottowia sp.]HOB65756.1 glycosyltransferase family 39 protein [Ottowia sp.]HPZ57532.1 glycosyltransferase family 39 protein [Ottowia sp.]HQD48965.1 glycosyltransferase family 39 protein [Ottowia sp.]
MSRPPDSAPHRWPLGLLACWVLLVLLGAVRPLALPDEGRYAEISRWMLVSGDWLVPRLNGLPFFHKPPLLHWLQASAMGVLGAHAWAARLVPAAAAGLMLAGLYVASRRLVGEPLARRAALMLALSAGFLLGGQYINHDMLVASWIASAIWCFALAFLQAGDGGRPHAGWARAGFVCCGLGILTKGLIGVALPGLVLFVWLSLARRWRQVPRLPWLSGLALFAAIAVPWFVLAAQRYPDLWSYMFGAQQFGRYTGGGFNNQQPWWFYVAGLLLLLFPWPVFMFFRRPALANKAADASEKIANDTLLLAWVWLLAILLFFSIPRSKLIGYVLPVLPPLALLAAAGWQRAMAGRANAGRWFAALAVVPLLISLGITFGFGPYQRHRLTADLARELACRAAPGDPVYLEGSGSFPYDLPFVAGLDAPLVVVQHWPTTRDDLGDGWEREMLEAGDFEPARAAELLRAPTVLEQAATQPRRWLVAPSQLKDGTGQKFDYQPPPGWRRVVDGDRWDLWQSAPEGPEAAQYERLPGCHDQRGDQRRP